MFGNDARVFETKQVGPPPAWLLTSSRRKKACKMQALHMPDRKGILSQQLVQTVQGRLHPCQRVVPAVTHGSRREVATEEVSVGLRAMHLQGSLVVGMGCCLWCFKHAHQLVLLPCPVTPVMLRMIFAHDMTSQFILSLDRPVDIGAASYT